MHRQESPGTLKKMFGQNRLQNDQRYYKPTCSTDVIKESPEESRDQTGIPRNVMGRFHHQDNSGDECKSEKKGKKQQDAVVPLFKMFDQQGGVFIDLAHLFLFDQNVFLSRMLLIVLTQTRQKCHDH